MNTTSPSSTPSAPAPFVGTAGDVRLLTIVLRGVLEILDEIQARWGEQHAALCALQRGAVTALMDLQQALRALLSARVGAAFDRLPADPPHLDQSSVVQHQAEAGVDHDLRVLCDDAIVSYSLARDIAEALRSDASARALIHDELVSLCEAVGARLKDFYQTFRRGARTIDSEEETRFAREAAAAERQARITAAMHVAMVSPDEPMPKAWSLLGWTPQGDPVVVPRDRGQVVLGCGVPGFGKSQAALTQIEAALRPRPGLSEGGYPTAVASFHVDATGISVPELLWAAMPNSRDADNAMLDQYLGVLPEPLPMVRLAVPEPLFDDYRERVWAKIGPPWKVPNLEVVPLRLPLGQLGAGGLAALLGAVGDSEDAQYLHGALADATELGDRLTLAEWRRRIGARPDLNSALRHKALARLSAFELLEAPPGSPAARADSGIFDLCQPGVLTVFALSGRWLPQRGSLPMVTALMHAISQPAGRHGAFQRFFHLDEVSRLAGDPRLWEHLVMTARQQRHFATTLWLLGQDLGILPAELIALARGVLLFRQGSPKLLLRLRERIPGLRKIRFSVLAKLAPGQALLCADFRDPALGQRQRIYVRPPACAHGGHSAVTI